MKRQQSTIRTGLLLPALLGALTPARALTSYLRRRYLERYAPRYARPARVFVFDMIVAGIAAVLIVGDVYLAYAPLPVADRLSLSFRTAEVKTLAPVAMEATIASHEAHAETGLRLRWTLPPGAEILSAQPALNDAGEMTMDTLAPGATQTAKIVVRLRSRVGDRVKIGFFLRDDQGWMRGTDEREVKGSGIQLGTTTGFQEEMPSSSWQVGWMRNTTDIAVEHLSIAGEHDVMLGPRATRLFEYRQENVEDNTRMGGSTIVLSSNGQSIQETSGWMIPDVNASDTPITLLPWTPGESLRIHVSKSFLDAYKFYSPPELVLIHPGLVREGHPDVTMTVPLTKENIDIPVTQVSDLRSWYAWAVLHCTEGYCSTSPLVRGHVTTPFVPDATVHYYLSSGDQVGIGPFPPKPGEATRVWVEWSLAPITKLLSHIRFESTLPAHVRYTGRVSLPDGGTFSEENGKLVWNLGQHDSSDVPLRARFEIEITPTDASGVIYQNPVQAFARDAEAGAAFDASTPAIKQ